MCAPLYKRIKKSPPAFSKAHRHYTRKLKKKLKKEARALHIAKKVSKHKKSIAKDVANRMVKKALGKHELGESKDKDPYWKSFKKETSALAHSIKTASKKIQHAALKKAAKHKVSAKIRALNMKQLAKANLHKLAKHLRHKNSAMRKQIARSNTKASHAKKMILKHTRAAQIARHHAAKKALRHAAKKGKHKSK